MQVAWLVVLNTERTKRVMPRMLVVARMLWWMECWSATIRGDGFKRGDGWGTSRGRRVRVEAVW